MKATTLIVSGLLLSVLGTGCTVPSSEPMVPQSQVGIAATLKQGIVLRSTPVTIEGDKSSLGTVSGAAIGGASASSVGGGGYGTETIIASAVGAAAGAVLGQTVEEAATRKDGQRITIRMDDGSIVEIVQQAEDGYFQEGDRVDVAVGAGSSRVALSMGIDTTPIAPSEPAWYEREGQ